MVTKALQSGACILVESSVVKPVRLSSHGKQSVPISVISCKNSISNAKPHVLTSNTTRFQTGNKVLLDQWHMLHKFLFIAAGMPIGQFLLQLSCLIITKFHNKYNTLEINDNTN
jgi:hypothetical protein